MKILLCHLSSIGSADEERRETIYESIQIGQERTFHLVEERHHSIRMINGRCLRSEDFGIRQIFVDEVQIRNLC